MSKDFNIRGIAEVQIGLPGDGIAGADLTSFTEFKVTSGKIGGGKRQKKTIPSENNSNYLTVSEGKTPLTFGIDLYEVKGEDLPMLLGGTWDDIGKKYSDPIGDDEAIYLTVILITEAVNGKKAKITYPYMFVAGSYEGNLANAELAAVNLDCEANTPVSALGVKASPRTIEWIAA